MATNNSEWGITTDIYDIVESVDNLKKRYVDDENETTLVVGIFGFLGDIESKKIQSSTITAGELGNEMFPSRAKLTKNVLTHATYSDITNINAIPADITLNFGIRLDDLDTYMVDDKFTIDCTSPIFVGDYEFHLDYDIIITRAKTKINSTNLAESYTYSAQYKLYDDDGNKLDNRLSKITNQYLITPFVMRIDNFYYLIMQVTVHQYSIEKTIDKLVTDSIIINKTYTFVYENQLANFDVYLTDNGETYKLRPFPWGSDPGDVEDYCWYIFLNDNTIRITFDNQSHIPGLNSDLTIVAYTSLGESGNFEYTKIDNTSVGFYFDLSSSDLGYNKVNCFAVAVTDSKNGKDRKTKEELQKLIPKAALARGNITNDTDVNNYFNLIENENNRLKPQKKEDNQLNRIWYVYFVLKDILGNIIPTNTIKIHIDLNSGFWYKSPDGRIIIPAGSAIKYNAELKIGELIDIGDIPNPTDFELFFDDEYYYYVTIYNIVLDRDPLYAAFYITSMNVDTYYSFIWVNTNANTQFVANKVNYQRNLLTDQYRYRFTYSIAQSILEDFGLYTVDYTQIEIEDDDGNTTYQTKEVISLNLKCVLVLYKDKTPYRWKECTFDSDKYVNDGNFIYNFYVDLFTDNGLDDQNSIKINDLNVAGSSSDTNYGYFRPNTEAYMYILARFDGINHDSIERGIGKYCLDNIAPGYNDYIVTNIYEIKGGIDFYQNYTGFLNTKVTALDKVGLNFNISGIPVVGGQYINIDLDESEDNADFIMDAIAEKKDYIDYCLELLENNMDIDFKFFNSYGPSINYRTEEEELIGHIDISLNFEVKLRSTSDIYTKDNIIARIKEIVEDIYDLGDLHIPNLITTITNEFSDRIEYIEFIGFNNFGPGIQHIVQDLSEDPHIPPEFINIRNLYDENTKSLKPAVNIDLV